jgi:hypothetical protein
VKECYIRGSAIKYLQVPDTLLDAVKEEQNRAGVVPEAAGEEDEEAFEERPCEDRCVGLSLRPSHNFQAKLCRYLMPLSAILRKEQ